MITIKNTQRKIAIDKRSIKKLAQQLLFLLDYQDFDLGIWFTSNKTIKQYNRDYRQKDKPTDVLSFGYHPTLQPGKRIKVLSEEDKNLGDLIISPEYVLHDAIRLKVSFEERMQLMIVHGILHLLGYDHVEDTDFRRMRAKEVALIKKLHE